MVPQRSKYSRYWIPRREITRMTNWWMTLIRNSKLLNRSNLLIIHAMRVYWHQKQMSMLLMKGSHILNNERITKRQKSLRYYTNHKKMQRFSAFLRELFSWGQNFLSIWRECFSSWYLWTSLLILTFWLNYLFNKANSIRNKTGGTF